MELEWLNWNSRDKDKWDYDAVIQPLSSIFFPSENDILPSQEHSFSLKSSRKFVLYLSCSVSFSRRNQFITRQVKVWNLYVLYLLSQTLYNGVIISRTLNWKYLIQIHFKYQKKQVVSSNAMKTRNETCSGVGFEVWISLLAPKSKLLEYSFLLPRLFMNMHKSELSTIRNLSWLHVTWNSPCKHLKG